MLPLPQMENLWVNNSVSWNSSVEIQNEQCVAMYQLPRQTQMLTANNALY